MHPLTTPGSSSRLLRALAIKLSAHRTLRAAAAAVAMFLGSVGTLGQDTDAARTETPVALDKFEVQGERTGDRGYNAPSSLTATKTDTALVNLPQSLTVVTEAQMRDQQMTSMGDVVRYVPGVSAHQGENNRDQIIFRGNSSSADFFVNGVRDDVQYYRDVYNLDRIEVLRGPNAMIFGRGGGGGVINRSTKEAGSEKFREITVAGGSFNAQRTTLDVNQPLNPRAAIRLNGLFENSGSFRKGVNLRREGISPSLALLPLKDTRITFSYEYLHDTRTADRGITSWQGRPAAVPTNLFYGNPADSHVRATTNLASSLIQHRTASGWEIRNRTMLGDYNRGYQNYVPGAVTGNQSLVALTAYNNATQRQNLFNQTDFTRHMVAGGILHTFLGGMELGRQLTANFRNTGYFNNTVTSLAVPSETPTINTPVTWRQSTTDADNHVKTGVGAIYAQDQIEFNRQWQAVAGLRFDSFALQYYNHRTGDYFGRRDVVVSPRVGLIYKPQPAISIYGSFSVSFLPSSGDQFSSLTSITQQVKPEKFTNHEVGAKFDLPRDAFLTAAIYQLDRTNTRATDPNDPTRILQTGSQRSQGLEIALNGTVTKWWSGSFGYAYQDAYLSSNTTAARAGATVAQVPKHSFSLWNKFQLTTKLGVGLGVIRRSDMFAAVDDTVTLPGYTRVDTAIFYALADHWRAQVNVENLANNKYYLNADSNTNISPGSPLAIRAGLTIRY